MHKKQKMIGIILVVIGIVFFIVGILFLAKKNENQATETIDIIREENSNEDLINLADINEQNVNRNLDIEDMINIAVADGYLSENEKTALRKYAKEKSLDAEKVINFAQKKIKASNHKKEVEQIDYNKKNGNDFEKYVVKKFDNKYFSIKNWRGDKYVAGQYAEDTPEPDLLLNFSLKNKVCQFAVECKWRSKYYKGGFELSEKDFEKYKQYEQTKEIPVFVVVGIGGTGANPENLYIIKLSSIESNFLEKNCLSKFKKEDKTRNFYFDNKTLELR